MSLLMFNLFMNLLNHIAHTCNYFHVFIPILWPHLEANKRSKLTTQDLQYLGFLLKHWCLVHSFRIG